MKIYIIVRHDEDDNIISNQHAFSSLEEATRVCRDYNKNYGRDTDLDSNNDVVGITDTSVWYELSEVDLD